MRAGAAPPTTPTPKAAQNLPMLMLLLLTCVSVALFPMGYHSWGDGCVKSEKPPGRAALRDCRGQGLSAYTGATATIDSDGTKKWEKGSVPSGCGAHGAILICRPRVW